MKSKVIIIISAILFGLTACGGKKSGNKDTHTHEDGSVHGNHATEQVAPAQESFKAKADSTASEMDSVKHDHGHDHDHSDPNHKH